MTDITDPNWSRPTEETPWYDLLLDFRGSTYRIEDAFSTYSAYLDGEIGLGDLFLEAGVDEDDLDEITEDDRDNLNIRLEFQTEDG